MIERLTRWFGRSRSGREAPVDRTSEEHCFTGRCPVCGKPGTFVRRHRFHREGYRCPTCRASYRYQAQAAALIGALGDGRAGSLVELVGAPGFASLRIYEPGIAGPFRPIWSGACEYRNSFWWPDVARGAERDGVPCQDLESLTFESESFDAVVTSDMLEHVRKPMAAFREIARVLEPGGVHVFSVPTAVPLPTTSVARVDTSGATDVHRLEPRYHGDGAGGRSLVYTDFGEDLLVRLAELGFDTELHVHRPSADVDAAATFVSRKRTA